MLTIQASEFNSETNSNACHNAINKPPRMPNDGELPEFSGAVPQICQAALGATVGGGLMLRAGELNDRTLADGAPMDSTLLVRASLDTVPDQIAVLDKNGVILLANEAWRRFGIESSTEPGKLPARMGIGANYLNNCQSDIAFGSTDAITLRDGIRAVLDGQLPTFSLEYPWHLKDQKRWFGVSVTPLGEKCPGAVVRHSNITERKKNETSLHIAAIVFESSEGMVVTDAHGVILQVNQSFTDITGYSRQEAMGKYHPGMLSSGQHDAAFYAAMWACVDYAGSWKGEIWNRRKNGEVYPEYLTINAVKGRDALVTNYIATLSGGATAKAAADEIEILAFYDPLTRLPNRRLLLDRLKHALVSIERKARGCALMLLDLDNFKTLNDTLGHNIGDLLLQQVARRLEACVRKGDTVARLGGDEFVIILSDLSEQALEAVAQTELVTRNILTALNQPYQLATHQCHSSPSIGATVFFDHQQVPDDLLRQADIAMYEAKKSGRNALRFFDQQMQDVINVRSALEAELRIALELQQFRLYFQIQVDDAHCPVGAEALLRWIKPESGLVLPSQFILLAEETGLILPIGQWVIETACAQLKEWEGSDSTRDLVLSVNVSARQFRQADFQAQVQAAVSRHAINPTLLKLELTESILLEHIEDTVATMNALKKIGVRFSLDDFGTGYSSLQYLKRLPLDEIKIDQLFVRDLAVDDNDKAIVRTIIVMAKSLNLEVIAEGVETEEQRQLLADMDCRRYQGYLFGKPVALAELKMILKSI